MVSGGKCDGKGVSNYEAVKANVLKVVKSYRVLVSEAC